MSITACLISLYSCVCSWLFSSSFFTFGRRIHALQPCWCKWSQFTFYFCSVWNDCVKSPWQLDESTAAERCWISTLELLLLLLLGQRYERPLLLSLQHNSKPFHPLTEQVCGVSGIVEPSQHRLGPKDCLSTPHWQYAQLIWQLCIRHYTKESLTSVL